MSRPLLNGTAASHDYGPGVSRDGPCAWVPRSHVAARPSGSRRPGGRRSGSTAPPPAPLPRCGAPPAECHTASQLRTWTAAGSRKRLVARRCNAARTQRGSGPDIEERNSCDTCTSGIITMAYRGLKLCCSPFQGTSRSSALGGPILVEFGLEIDPKSVCPGPILSEVCRIWPPLGPKSFTFGRSRPEFGRCRSNVGRCLHNLAQLGRSLAKVGRSAQTWSIRVAEFGRSCPEFGQTSPALAALGPLSHRSRPTLREPGESWPQSLASIGPPAENSHRLRSGTTVDQRSVHAADILWKPNRPVARGGNEIEAKQRSNELRPKSVAQGATGGGGGRCEAADLRPKESLETMSGPTLFGGGGQKRHAAPKRGSLRMLPPKWARKARGWANIGGDVVDVRASCSRSLAGPSHPTSSKAEP